MVFIGNHYSPWGGRPSGIAESRCSLIHHPSKGYVNCSRRGKESPPKLHASRSSYERRKILCPSKSGGKELHDGNKRKTHARDAP